MYITTPSVVSQMSRLLTMSDLVEYKGILYLRVVGKEKYLGYYFCGLGVFVEEWHEDTPPRLRMHRQYGDMRSALLMYHTAAEMDIVAGVGAFDLGKVACQLHILYAEHR